MFSKKSILKFMSYWPPYLGAGISVDYIAPDFSKIEVSMKLKFWNKNYVGTHFGGSLYAMTDPFFMLILIERLGPNYIVWDKAACINFKKPGQGKVKAVFEITDEKITAIKEELLHKEKIYPVFTVNVLNEKQEIVSIVEKTLYVKRK
jgi:hypothetical protein